MKSITRRKRVVLAVVILVAAGGATLFAVTTAWAGHSSASPIGRWGQGAPATVQQAAEDTRLGAGGEKLVLIEDETQGQLAFIDVGDPGFSPGDYAVFRDPLFDEDQSQQLGFVSVNCTFVFARALCHGVAELSGKGKISFAGTAVGSRVLLGLTGGTRDFKTVDGQVLVQVGVPREGLDTLTFQIITD